MPRAMLRAIPNSFHAAITGERGRPPDVALARRQHDRYRRHLEEAGFSVRVLEADEKHPDSVFVEDCAVVVGDKAVITRPGAPSRRGETQAVARALASDLAIVPMVRPATLDGGDVMVMGARMWVGLSSRTNRGGAAQLARAAPDVEVIEVPVSGVLHLKSAVLPIDQQTVVVTPGTMDEGLLDGLAVIHEHPEERHLFSALPLAESRVLVTAAAPRTNELLARRGLEIVPIDVSEIQAADGGLTCMSILY